MCKHDQEKCSKLSIRASAAFWCPVDTDNFTLLYQSLAGSPPGYTLLQVKKDVDFFKHFQFEARASLPPPSYAYVTCASVDTYNLG